MELALVRSPAGNANGLVTSDNYATYGQLLLDGVHECETLEPCPFDIPAGTYQVVKYNSPKFKMPVPRVLDVPGHEGIEIHPGNYAHDTAGCVLVGLAFVTRWDPYRQQNETVLDQSRVAFGRLMDAITHWPGLTLTVSNGTA